MGRLKWMQPLVTTTSLVTMVQTADGERSGADQRERPAAQAGQEKSNPLVELLKVKAGGGRFARRVIVQLVGVPSVA